MSLCHKEPDIIGYCNNMNKIVGAILFEVIYVLLMIETLAQCVDN